MIDKNTTASNNLSDNKIASDNKLVLWEKFNIDIHFQELVMFFFKPTRSAMLQSRLLEFYRVQSETILKILDIAKEISNKHGLQINPIPSKLAVPLLEKMSTEHEEDMYEIWAKLLVSSSLNYDPISIYYAEILSKIGSKEAKLLLEMYKVQTQYASFMAYAGRMGKYSEELEYFNTERFMFKALQVKALDTLSYLRRFCYIPTPVYIKIKHCFKKLTTKAERDFRGYANDLYDMAMPFNKPECSHSLEILSSVGLVLGEPREMPVLTKLGYDMVRTLERDSKEKLCLNLKSTKRKH